MLQARAAARRPARSGLNGGNTTGDVMPGGPSCATEASRSAAPAAQQTSSAAHETACTTAMARQTASCRDAVHRYPRAHCGRNRKRQARQRAGLASGILDLAADMCRPSPSTRRVPRPVPLAAAVAAADAVVLDQKLATPVRQPLQADPHFAAAVRIGIFERIGDPFGHDHAEIDAGIGRQLQRLEMVAQRGAVAFALHRSLQLVEQAGQIFVERDEPHIARTVEPLVDRPRSRRCALRSRPAPPWRPGRCTAFDCSLTSDATSVRLLATRWLTSASSTSARSRARPRSTVRSFTRCSRLVLRLRTSSRACAISRV